jgi:hypothetical protein
MLKGCHIESAFGPENYVHLGEKGIRWRFSLRQWLGVNLPLPGYLVVLSIFAVLEPSPSRFRVAADRALPNVFIFAAGFKLPTIKFFVKSFLGTYVDLQILFIYSHSSASGGSA